MEFNYILLKQNFCALKLAFPCALQKSKSTNLAEGSTA